LQQENVTLRETAKIIAGEAVVVGILFLVFALLDRFDYTVILGSLLGAAINIAYFFFMCLGVNLAMDKEEPHKQKQVLNLSYILRLAFMALGLAAGLKFSCFNNICVVVPLLVTRPILTLTALLSKEVK